MNSGRTIFSQLMDFVPIHDFRQCVKRYNGNYKVKSFSCWDQFLCMAFAQLTYRESLRDIEACLRAAQNKTLSPGHPRQGLTQHPGQRQSGEGLADLCRLRPGPDSQGKSALRRRVLRRGIGSDGLCTGCHHHRSLPVALSLGQFRKHKGAIKLHTLLDLQGKHSDSGNCHPRQGSRSEHPRSAPSSKQVPSTSWIGAISTLPDFMRSIRPGPSSSSEPKTTSGSNASILSPWTRLPGCSAIRLSRPGTSMPGRIIPEKLRRIRFFDKDNNRRLVFLTNNFTLPALTIAELYRCRWQIELFFKWIKQHLRIKAFYGTTENAVKTQIWIAISVYVLVAIVKKSLKIDSSLYTILQILSVTLFEKTPIIQGIYRVNRTSFRVGSQQPTDFIRLTLGQ